MADKFIDLCRKKAVRKAEYLSSIFLRQADTCDLEVLSQLILAWEKIGLETPKRVPRVNILVRAMREWWDGEDGEEQNGPEMDESLKESTLQELRQKTRDLEFDETRKLFAAALDLAGSDDSELALLTVCQRLLRENRSVDTPVEEFVHSLLFSSLRQAMTIEEVRGEMEEFELNWRDALKTARKFRQEYPDLMNTPESRSVELQEVR